MEFKGRRRGVCISEDLCINRIRLEFKAPMAQVNRIRVIVLIESDWNLKEMSMYARMPAHCVLIESDWNLKNTARCRSERLQWVLIESDWNLKSNRIYLLLDRSFVLIESDWNLKSFPCLTSDRIEPVLIESDWNLKCRGKDAGTYETICINRIRLEFKGGSIRLLSWFRTRY